MSQPNIPVLDVPDLSQLRRPTVPIEQVLTEFQNRIEAIEQLLSKHGQALRGLHTALENLYVEVLEPNPESEADDAEDQELPMAVVPDMD